VDYSASASPQGWAATPSTSVWYKKIGKMVFVLFDISGTSNDTIANFNAPFSQDTRQSWDGITSLMLDNGSGLAYPGRVSIGSGHITIYKDMYTGAFTASGSKRVHGEFWYQTP
jgi:hypothetical protein